jgi:hypothetical protein
LDLTVAPGDLLFWGRPLLANKGSVKKIKDMANVKRASLIFFNFMRVNIISLLPLAVFSGLQSVYTAFGLTRQLQITPFSKTSYMLGSSQYQFLLL